MAGTPGMAICNALFCLLLHATQLLPAHHVHVHVRPRPSLCSRLSEAAILANFFHRASECERSISTSREPRQSANANGEDGRGGEWRAEQAKTKGCRSAVLRLLRLASHVPNDRPRPRERAGEANPSFFSPSFTFTQRSIFVARTRKGRDREAQWYRPIDAVNIAT